MNTKEFFELTGKVRAVQKLYYKSRLQGDLIASKMLERQLDQALKEGLDPEPTAVQMSLVNVTGGEGVQIRLLEDDKK